MKGKKFQAIIKKTGEVITVKVDGQMWLSSKGILFHRSELEIIYDRCD